LSPENKINLLVVDDHTLIRETWSFILNAHPNFQVVGECGSGEEAIELAKKLRPHIVITDINLPGISGLDTVPDIHKYSPGTRVLAVSMHTQPSFARKMMVKGAMGYMTKNSSRQELFYALKEIHSGRKYICKEIRNILSDQVLAGDNDSGPGNIDTLSHREMEIIGYLKKGFSSREIAENLNVTAKTVDAHRYNILKKLKLKNTAALVNFINQHNLGA
jgi:two-component system invasion response regulator UvrY